MREESCSPHQAQLKATAWQHHNIPNEIYEIGLTASQIAVYAYLSRCSNQGSTAFPSYETIGRKSGTSRATAIRAVKALVEKGLIDKEVRKTDYDENKTNIYIVRHDRLCDYRGGVTVIPPSVTMTPRTRTTKQEPILTDSGESECAQHVKEIYAKAFADYFGYQHRRVRIPVDMEIDTSDIDNLRECIGEWFDIHEHLPKREVLAKCSIERFAASLPRYKQQGFW